MSKIKENYLNKDYVIDVVYNYRKNRNRKNEYQLVDIIKNIIIHIQVLPKYSGYCQEIKDDMSQVAMFNFFNNIHDIKFSKKKLNKIINIKKLDFFEKYNNISEIKNYAGKKLYCNSIHESNKKLYCNPIIYISDEREDEKLIELCQNNKDYEFRISTIRLGGTDQFIEKYLVIDNSINLLVDYDDIYFDMFAFITQIVKTSFYQVLNRENAEHESAQVILWENSDAYKFDINNDSIQKKIVETIRNVQKNRSK